jgi:TRAP-type C4-dicarboxylate transport system substrate-binding protein
MILQVNYKEMLQRINKDLIEDHDVDDYEKMRDEPEHMKINKNTTENKMELWRKNIKDNFGDNGKVHLW